MFRIRKVTTDSASAEGFWEEEEEEGCKRVLKVEKILTGRNKEGQNVK